MPNESKPAGGRKPAPIKYRFLKGKSGNPRGRPRGSVTLSTAARKVALKKPSVNGETAKRQTVIEHVLDVLKREAARGIPSMMDLFEHIYRKLNPYADNRPGGFLVVPETLTQEEWMAQAEKHNATARDPSLPREPDAETEAAAAVAEMKRKLVLAEVEKARHGLSSPLGHAMLAYERKWRESYSPVR